MKEKLFKSVLLMCLVVASLVAQAQCPPGATALTPGTTVINSGQTYCASSNMSIGNLTINNGGKLYVASGVVLTSTGVITVEGELELQNSAGLKLTGSMTLGAATNINSLITIGQSAYVSMSGSFTQVDATNNNAYPSRTAQVVMEQNSVFEICGTYQHQSKVYPAVKYATGADPAKKAYFIVKGSAGGGGIGSILSNNSQINWIAMSAVANITKGSASYCGPNGTSTTCPDIWPTGLTNDISACFQAPLIINCDVATVRILVTESGNCILGCNDNTFVNSDDPNTIEYDNVVSVFHSTIVRETDGSVKTWGEGIASNGTGNLTSVTLLNNTNYPGLDGTILRFTGGSTSPTSTSNIKQQFAVLTTKRLYIWGETGTLVSTGVKSSTGFDTVAIATYGVPGTKLNGLPDGVDPLDVKMLFGSYATLALVTCTGDVWVLSFEGNKNGDGSTQGSRTNNNVWHRVYESTTSNGSTKGDALADIVAVRGTYNALFALSSDGKIYTWGTATRLGNGAGPSNRTYATLMNLPTGITPKMIGMTASSDGSTYYLLGTNGELYGLGENGTRQLGDYTTTDRNDWTRVKESSTTNMSNVAWISPQEHHGGGRPDHILAAINAIKEDGKLWAWGENSSSMLGGTATLRYPTSSHTASTGNIGANDFIIAVETGGHTSISFKKCSKKFGYVGHKISGSMANNDPNDDIVTSYNFTNTAELLVCGVAASPTVQDLKICPAETANLSDAHVGSIPSFYNLVWYLDSTRTTAVPDPAVVGPGTYYAFYIPKNPANCNDPWWTSMEVKYYSIGMCTTDTIIDTLCKTCVDTVCVNNSFVESSITLTFCNGDTTMSSSLLDGNIISKTCIEFTAKNNVGVDTICVILCDTSIGLCDTSIIIVNVPPTKDTIFDTVPTMGTIIPCINLENGMTPSSTNISFCDGTDSLTTTTLGTATIDSAGCITYSANETNGNEMPICVVACDTATGICDTTIVMVHVTKWCLNMRVYLEGAIIENGGATSGSGRPLMRDNLRNSPFTGANYIPTKDPYSFATEYTDITASFTKVGPGLLPINTQIVDSATVFGVTGDNAIVDWVFVELRSKTDSTVVVATRSGLVQRDGDVVELDGTSCLVFHTVPVDNYYVVIRHRNHLGAMTKFAQTPAQLSAGVDFTSTTLPLYDFGSTVVPGYDYTGLAENENVAPGYRVLWAGNFDANNVLKAANPNDDINVLLFEILGYPSNTTANPNYDFAYGYFQGDFNLNSKDKIDNPDDDTNYLLFQVLGYPLNTLFETNFDLFYQQIPQ